MCLVDSLDTLSHVNGNTESMVCAVLAIVILWGFFCSVHAYYVTGKNCRYVFMYVRV